MTTAPDKVAVLVNPAAAQGRVGRAWPGLAAELRKALGDFEVLNSEAAGHGRTLVRGALATGATRIVSVGGDGTHFEALNGCFQGDALINPEVVVAIMPLGTGSDLARSLGIPQGMAALPHVTSTKILRTDVARITCMGLGGAPHTCYFQNIARIGIGGEVVDRVNRTTKHFGGFVSYLMGTLISLVVYRDMPIDFAVDGRHIRGLTKDFILAKGSYDGGGMHVAPHALLDNGVFDLYHIGRIGALDAMMSLPKIYRGRLNQRPDVVKYLRGAVIRAESSERVKVEADGELLGYLPATIEIVPKALKMVVGNAPRSQGGEATKPENASTP